VGRRIVGIVLDLVRRVGNHARAADVARQMTHFDAARQPRVQQFLHEGTGTSHVSLCLDFLAKASQFLRGLLALGHQRGHRIRALAVPVLVEHLAGGLHDGPATITSRSLKSTSGRAENTRRRYCGHRPRHEVVRHHQLVVHAAVQAAEIDHHLGPARGAVGKRVEQPGLDVRMGVERRPGLS
jgi:hypothetical protein